MKKNRLSISSLKHQLVKVSVLSFLFFTFNSASAQVKEIKARKKWNDKLLTFENQYLKGYYHDVYDYSLKTAKGLNKQKGFTEAYIFKFYLMAALGADGLNKFENKNSALDSAFYHLHKIPSDSISSIIDANLALSKFNNYTGFYKSAEDILIDLQKKYDGKITKYQLLKLNQYLANIYTHQGKNNAANELILKITNESNTFATSKKIDENGNPTSKVSSLKLNERKLDHAKLLNNKIEILINKGDYKNVGNEIENTNLWMKKNLGSKNPEARYLKTLKADQFLLDNNIRKASKYYNKAYSTGGFKISEGKKMNINRKLLETYISLNKLSKYKKYSRKLQLNSKRNYSKNSFYYADFMLVEIDRNIEKNNNKRAKSLMEDFNVDFSTLPILHPARINYLNSQYSIAIRMSDIALAESILNDKLLLIKTLYGDHTTIYHKVKLQQLDFIVKYKNNIESIDTVKKISYDKIVKPEMAITHNEYATYLNTFANFEDLLDNIKKSENYLNEATQATSARFGNTDINYAYELQLLAKVKLEKGNYIEADTLLKQALKIAKAYSPQSDEKVIDIYRGVSTLYYTLGEYDEAKKLLNRALNSSYKTKAKGELNIATSIDLMASLFASTGRFTDAEELLLEAVKLKETKLGSDNKALISSLNLLGNVYLATGDYAAAEKNIRRALSISTQIFGDTSISATESMELLKGMYTSIGDLQRAESFAKLVLKNHTRVYGKKHITTAASLASLAMVQMARKKVKKETIEKMLNEAADVIKQSIGTNCPAYADVIEKQADFYFQNKNYQKADTLLGISNQFWISKLSKYNVHSAAIWLLRGEIELERQNYKKAAFNFEKSQKNYENIFSNTHPDYVNATSKLARVYYIEGEKKKSLDLLEQTTYQYLSFTKQHFSNLTFSEKSKYWNKIKEDFEFFNTTVLTSNEIKPSLIGDVYNNVISTKALLLNSSIKIKQRINSSGDTVLINKFNKWVENKEYLTSVISLSLQQQKEIGIDVKQIEKTIESLEKEISQRSEEFAQNEKSDQFDWKDVRDALKENEYAVEIIKFRYFSKSFTDSVIYAALILHSDSKQPEIVLLPNGKQLENRYLKYFRNCVKFKNEDKYSFDNYWKPIKAKIPDGAMVYLSSEGVYSLLNIEMMPTGNGKYSIDQNTFVVVKNSKELPIKALVDKLKKKKKIQSTSNNYNNLIICANPQFYEFPDSAASSHTVANLPGAEEEGNMIEKIAQSAGISTTKYVGIQVDEDKIKEIKSPKILHFATHGTLRTNNNTSDDENEYLSSPLLNSGLLMKNGGDVLDEKDNTNMNIRNGVLTAFEASSMNLDGTELVMMSACETGVGQVEAGEGVQGLQYAFLIAGAKAVGMTLFKVNDEVTMKLMEQFYKKMLAGVDKRIAFAEAKKVIKDEYKHPIFWGSFVLIGVE